MNNKQKEDTVTLEILQVIEGKRDVTQRHLADRLGVALGLTNSYLKRCVRKGFIKIHHVPANRYLYYLTPKGLAEKSRLTIQYLSSSFDLYRRSGESYTEIFDFCELNNWLEIVLCGISELTEIACIRAYEHNVNIVGVFEPESKQNEYLRLPVIKKLEEISRYDAWIITALYEPDTLFNKVQSEVIYKERVLLPSMLGFIQDGVVAVNNNFYR